MYDVANPSLISDLRDIDIVNEYIPGGVIIAKTDPDFTILEANRGYFNLVGYSKEEIFELYQNKGFLTLHPDDVNEAVVSFNEQIQDNRDKSFSIKSRLINKEVGYKWVHFTGRLVYDKLGQELICFLLVDISDHLRILEQFQKEQAFNSMIASLTDDAFFDCDLLTKTMRYSKNLAERLGIDEIIYNYPKPLFEKNLISNHSLSLFQDRFMNAEEDIVEEELHLILPDNTDVWYLCHYNIIKDDLGRPIRSIGKLTDITKQRAKIDELSNKAQRDQLTGLYNKVTTEFMIKEILKRRSNDDKHALLIIDIDNFKNINDRLGHLYGDIVLTQLAESLKPIFRSDDIIGRVGGDEFFVFLKNYKTTEVLKAKAAEICNLFSRTYSEHHASVSISASVGIALCPEHGIEFNTLYKNADAALYITKAAGKSSYTLFEAGTVQANASIRTKIDSSGLNKSFKDHRVEYVFKLLYDSENPVASVGAVLQLISESFGFSRGYIFENSVDGKFTSNTYEWCADGISPEIQNLQNIPIESVTTSMDSFKRTGMFILKSLDDLPQIERDVLEPQGILSMFQFGIMDGRKPVGLIGFDDCVKERIPAEQEIDEICTICHVLATFLLKQRGAERELSHYQAVETVLNSINSYAYVIDKNNYTVLYENEMVKQLTGGPSVGKKCHMVYRGNQEPCADCPMSFLTEAKNSHTMEIHNTKYDIYVRADATGILWADGVDACLVNSVDITEYKK